MLHFQFPQQVKSYVLGISICCVALTSCQSGNENNTEQTIITDTPVSAPVTPPVQQDTATTTDASKVLTGQWQRSDGGYSLVFKEVKPNGELDANYFNPNPIHVQVANWKNSNEGLKVYVELNDVNYNGSNYTLYYLKDKDILSGKYYQAAAKETYEVYFTRMAANQ
jgi:hypothetical protein